MNKKHWSYGLKIGVGVFLVLLLITFLVDAPTSGEHRPFEALLFLMALNFGWPIVPVTWLIVWVYQKYKERNKTVGNTIQQ